MNKAEKRRQARRAPRLKTPLWLGVLTLAASCAVWAGLHALPARTPQTPASFPAREAPSASSAPRPAPRRVPVLEDVGGYPVMARLEIAAIGLELPVIAELSDEALKTAPCLYAGPGTPKDAGNLVLVGHNYRSDAQFGRLNELEAGAAVRLTDRYGEPYEYEVYACEIIAPDEICALEDYEGEHGLALITCTADGSDRLLVKCRLTGGL